MGIPLPSNQNVLEYLSSLQVRLFPLPKGSKVPIAAGFLESASPAIRFELSGNNVGVATGGGYVALDFDTKPDKGIDGVAILNAWLTAGLLPEDTPLIKTPSGGCHMYLRLPEGHGPVANSASKLAPGVDVRGDRGYVVGPGSTLPNGAYEVLHAAPAMALCPKWLLERFDTPRDRAADMTPLVELDTDWSVARATKWLRDEAPIARSDTGETYRTACRVKDFGVSEHRCLDLMLGDWNSLKADPPWDAAGLAEKIERAYRYGTSPAGIASPQADFTEALTQGQLAAIEATRLAHERPQHEDQPDRTTQGRLSGLLHPMDPFTPSTVLEPRRFVVSRFAARKFVTLLVAPGGAGKTTFGMGAALAVASGKPVLGETLAPVGGPQHALYWTQEDDLNDVRLRLTALMRASGVEWSDLMGDDGRCRLHMFSGVDRPFVAAVRGSDGRTLLASQDAADMLDYMKGQGIRFAAFDPFVEMHPAEENDNGEVGRVARVFRRIAVTADCAVVIVHHTAKHDKASSDDVAGDMGKARGASALVGVARMVFTLYGLGDKGAKDYGVGAADRHRYVRLDEAKSNLTLVAGEPVLFERRGVPVWEIGAEVGVLVEAGLKRVEGGRDRREIAMDGVDRSDFAADVALAVGNLRARSVKAARWDTVADEARALFPERYGDVTDAAFRKRCLRMFDAETGKAIVKDLEGCFTIQKGAGTLLSIADAL